MPKRFCFRLPSGTLPVLGSFEHAKIDSDVCEFPSPFSPLESVVLLPLHLLDIRDHFGCHHDVLLGHCSSEAISREE